MSSFFQALEQRTFLSGTPVHSEPSPELREQYQKDVLQYVADSKLMSDTLAADRAAVFADMKALRDSQSDAKAKFDADTRSFYAALKADGEAGAPTYLKWKATLEADK